MKKNITLFFLLLCAVMQAGAQNQNISNIIGPQSVCANVPVRYRVVFLPSCSAPSITDIRKYNQNEGGGNLASYNYIGSGNLPTGEFYEDFDLVFTINFGSFPNGDGIGIVFQCVCSGNPNTQQIKGLNLSITPPPLVEIVSSDGSNTILTHKLAGRYIGSKNFTGSVSTATATTTYLWSVNDPNFSISGPDNQYQVNVSSNAATPQNGTLILQAGTSGCGLITLNYLLTARPAGISKMADITDPSAKLPAMDAASLVIYGNPVANNLVAKIINNRADDLTKKDVLIYDANKRLVKMYRGYTSNSTINLDVSGLSNGVYFLNIVSPKSALSLTEKFVIQR